MLFPVAQLVIPGPVWGNILVALMFGVILTSLTYFAGAITQSPKVNAAAKEELIALIFSIMIIGSFAFVLATLSQITAALFADAAQNAGFNQAQISSGMIRSHFDLANSALDILFVKLKSIYASLYLYDVLIGFLSTMSFPLGNPMPFLALITFSFMPFDGLVLLVNAHTIVVEAVGYLITVIMAKQVLLIFSRDVVIAILLPLGLVMRAFPWLRMTGSSLIALSVTLYFIYPLTLLLTNYMIFDVYKPVDFVYSPNQKMLSFFGSDDSKTIDPNTQDELEELKERSEHVMNGMAVEPEHDCSGVTFAFLCNLKYYGSMIYSGISGFVGTVWNVSKFMWGFGGDYLAYFLGTKGGSALFGSTVSGLYKFVIEEVVTVSQFIVLVTITSVIEIIITVTMYRNIALLIGGEVEIAGLTKLV